MNINTLINISNKSILIKYFKKYFRENVRYQEKIHQLYSLRVFLHRNRR